ncbi:MAG: PfkB family carbohydrate kinase [Phycisphaerae bacterium]|nr:PfkB family carbohydrate kinase [Phycisphaerae bacterium]
MPLLVTGSIGIDTVTTPYGVSENCLGGSAVYFSMAASFFAPVRFVGVVGGDCPFDLKDTFEGRKVDLSGLEVRDMSRTFRWKGSYYNSMNEAITDQVELNVLSEKPPVVPEKFRNSRFVFLANTAPKLQIQLLEQIARPIFVAADTMNLWIENTPDDLRALLKKIDCLVLNEDEARQLSGENNLILSAKTIIGLGPRVVIIKKGESGSIMCDSQGDVFVLLAYPATQIKDPTGAGDSFAGGMMGYMAKTGKADFATLKKAIAYGTVAASFTISDFSLKGLQKINNGDIERRLEKLRKATQF